MKPSVTKLSCVSIAKVNLFSRNMRALVNIRGSSYFHRQGHVRYDKVMNFKRREIKMKVGIIERNKRNKVHFSRHYRFIANIDRDFMSECYFSGDMTKVN